MPVKFLKKLKDIQKIDGSLKYRLHKKMAAWDAARSISTVHASDITKPEFCPREFALLDETGKKPKGQFIGTSLRATFDLGNALQDSLNTDWGLDWCVGTWECQVCGSVFNFQKKPDACADCDNDLFRYIEERFISPGHGFSGSVDYIFDCGEPLLKLVEVKTMVKDQFKTLKAPLSEHKDRTNMYIRLVDEADDWRSHRINKEEALVFYICKGFGCMDNTLKEKGIADAAFSPFKEFTVKRDDSLSDMFVAKAQAVHNFRNGGKMPHKICDTSFCKRAKGCPVKNECWGGDYV